MKKTIVSLATLCTLNAFAQALPDSIQTAPQEAKKDGSSLPMTAPQQTNYSRKAIDLIVFPNPGEIIAGIEYFSSSLEYKWTYLSWDFLNIEIESSGLNYDVRYAFNDYWAASVQAEEVLSSKQTITYGPVSKIDGQTREYKSSGFDDPSFLLMYRAMDVSRDRYDMNLSVNFSPKMQDAEGATVMQGVEGATVAKKGNNAKGGTNLGVAVEWGRRGPAFSWSVGLKLENNGKAKSKDPDDGDITTVESYGTFFVSGGFQWVVSPKVALDLNLTLENTGEIDVKYADGSTLKYDNATIFGIGGTANVTLQDKLYLTFDLKWAAASDQNVTDENNDVVIDTERAAGIFSVGIIKQF